MSVSCSHVSKSCLGVFANKILHNRLDQSVKGKSLDSIQESTASTISESFNGESMQEDLPRSQHLEVQPLM